MMKRIALMVVFAMVLCKPAFGGVYADGGDGTVTDAVSTLMWQKQDVGAAQTWEAAIAYCEGLSLGGHSDWRLPNVKELSSLVDDSRYSPAINTTYFPATRSSNYWSSTTNADFTTSAWSVSFDSGYTDYHSKAYPYDVRCVR